MSGNQVLVILVALLSGGIVAALLLVFLPEKTAAEKRLKTLANIKKSLDPHAEKQERVSARKRDAMRAVEEADLGNKNKKRGGFSLSLALQQANIQLEPKTFMVLSLGGGTLVTILLTATMSLSILMILGVWVICSIAIPRFILRFRQKKRQRDFLNEFPNMIDIVVRSVKSGIPVNEAFQISASEGPEPIRSELARSMEKLVIGLPLNESILDLHERIPLTEVMFLALVIQIQGESGGSIASALSNLASVLRERKKLQGKIQAMSQEAKVSTVIIASLPLLVTGGMMVGSPEYISTLFTTEAGNKCLVAAGILMIIGLVIIRKMSRIEP